MGFSVSSAYDIENETPTTGAYWNKLWKLVTLPRIKTFLWLLGHDKLLTKENCLKKGLAGSAICPRCSNSVESVLHMLQDCLASRQIWSNWLHGSHLEHFCNLPL